MLRHIVCGRRRGWRQLSSTRPAFRRPVPIRWCPRPAAQLCLDYRRFRRWPRRKLVRAAGLPHRQQARLRDEPQALVRLDAQRNPDDLDHRPDELSW